MTKTLFRLLLLLFLPSVAFAQGARVDSNATRNVQGFLAPIAGATITVCTSAGTGTPCTPLVPTSPVTLCTDSTCTVAAANPFLADANGNFGFWAIPGTYKVSVTAPGVTGYLLTVTLPCAAGISCVALSNPNTFTALQTFNAGLTSAGPNTLNGGGSLAGTFTGSHTLSGTVTLSGQVVSGNLGVVNLGSASQPFNDLYLGLTATNNWVFLSGATTGPRPILMTDPGSAFSGGVGMPFVLYSNTATMTTALIGAGACGTTVTVAANGVLTTDVVTWSFNAAPAANPGVLIVSAWPTANNVNFQYCNPTAAGVTPNAATLNWKVIR